MAIDSRQRGTLRVGGTRLCRIDLRKDLDEGDTVASATVEELSTTDLTFGAVVVSAEVVILKQTVPLGKAIEFTVRGHIVANTPYRMKVKMTTSGGQTDVVPKEDFVFDVVA